MSGFTVVGFLIAAASVLLAVYGLARYECTVEEGELVIRSSFAGIRGWTYRCPLSNIDSYKYPAVLFDLGAP